MSHAGEEVGVWVCSSRGNERATVVVRRTGAGRAIRGNSALQKHLVMPKATVNIARRTNIDKFVGDAKGVRSVGQE